MLESTDGGASWEVTAAFDSPDTGGLDYAEIVAAPQAFSLSSHGGHGSRRIFQTRDGGPTWRVLSQRGRFGRSALLSLSQDGGATWEARSLPEVPSTPQILARHPAELDTLAVAYENGTVIVSRDEGRTWQATGAGPPESEANELAFGPDDNRLYIFRPSSGLFWIELPQP